VQVIGNVTLDEEDGLAVVVDVEQLRRQRVATVVTLALLGIEVYSHGDDCRGQSGPVTSPQGTFSHSVPILLLPPSEGKAVGGNARRVRWSPESGSFGRVVGDRRRTLVDTLAAIGGGDAKLLGVRGDHLDRARHANASLNGAPTLPAWQRYTGVVWDHLRPTTLPPPAMKQIVVVSGLLGLVRGDDPVPDCRLKMGASLPGIGKLSTWWRDDVSDALDRTTRRRFVIDLLPQEHRAAWIPGWVPSPRVRGVTVQLVDPSGAPGGHFAKAAKGSLARAILLEGVGALHTWRDDRFELHLTDL